jgi:hypothetical protein
LITLQLTGPETAVPDPASLTGFLASLTEPAEQVEHLRVLCGPGRIDLALFLLAPTAATERPTERPAGRGHPQHRAHTITTPSTPSAPPGTPVGHPVRAPHRRPGGRAPGSARVRAGQCGSIGYRRTPRGPLGKPENPS